MDEPTDDEDAAAPVLEGQKLDTAIAAAAAAGNAATGDAAVVSKEPAQTAEDTPAPEVGGSSWWTETPPYSAARALDFRGDSQLGAKEAKPESLSVAARRLQTSWRRL